MKPFPGLPPAGLCRGEAWVAVGGKAVGGCCQPGLLEEMLFRIGGREQGLSARPGDIEDTEGGDHAGRVLTLLDVAPQGSR